MRVCRIMKITQMVHGALCRVSARGQVHATQDLVSVCTLKLRPSYAELDFDGLVYLTYHVIGVILQGSQVRAT